MAQCTIIYPEMLRKLWRNFKGFGIALSIDGTGATLRWTTGTAPTPTSTANKLDVFSFTLIRRASAWIVIGSSVLNF